MSPHLESPAEAELPQREEPQGVPHPPQPASHRFLLLNLSLPLLSLPPSLPLFLPSLFVCLFLTSALLNTQPSGARLGRRSGQLPGDPGPAPPPGPSPAGPAQLRVSPRRAG